MCFINKIICHIDTEKSLSCLQPIIHLLQCHQKCLSKVCLSLLEWPWFFPHFIVHYMHIYTKAIINRFAPVSFHPREPGWILWILMLQLQKFSSWHVLPFQACYQIHPSTCLFLLNSLFSLNVLFKCHLLYEHFFYPLKKEESHSLSLLFSLLSPISQA
jgi:hypothetical protein